MNELNQAWRTYRNRVIPPDAPSVQAIECRRAYFFGCKTALDILAKLQDQPEFIRTREIDALLTEHRAFMLEHDRPETLIIQ